MGINVEAINPTHLKLYGRIGGPLPQANSTDRRGEPQEIPLYMVGAEDGSWNQDDYALFLASSADHYAYDALHKHYVYENNPYGTRSFYFLTFSPAAGARIQTSPSLALSPSQVHNNYDFVYMHEEDKTNLLHSGRTWYGDFFYASSERNQSFTLSIPSLTAGSTLHVSSLVFGACFQFTCGFSITINDTPLPEEHIISPITRTRYGIKGRASHIETTIPAAYISGHTLRVRYTFTGGDNTSFGAVNRLVVEGTATLRYEGGVPLFFQNSAPEDGIPTQYVITSNQNPVLIWHTTDPLKPTQQLFSQEDNKRSFVVQAASWEQYVIFSPTDDTLISPTYEGEMSNQNLKNQRITNFLIITHPNFLLEANRLADFRRRHDGLSVEVATTEQVYHEFASGTPDPTAIRNYVRYLHALDAGQSLKYLLLFGDCSYDFRGIKKGSSVNYVPVYESREHLDATKSYSSDDYYGFLEEEEGTWYEDVAVAGDEKPHDLEIGIGRFPVQTAQQAAQLVDKLIRYSTPSEAGRGPWRQTVYFVADDGENNYIHEESEQIANEVSLAHPHVQVEKFFLDNYPQHLEGGQQHAPQAKHHLMEAINEGALIINFIGHGDTTGWMDENILEADDIDRLSNSHRLPLFFTGTCDFGNYDGDAVSGGEKMLLHPFGGGIALLTATRAITGASNSVINKAFYETVFQRDDKGRYLRLGDIVRHTKNEGVHGVANRNFALLGDPAMRLAYPEDTVHITHINETAVDAFQETLAALSRVQIRGEIRGNDEQTTRPNYMGILTFTVYDQLIHYLTLGDENPPYSYQRENPIFRGQATITAGTFSFFFLLPKDISYQRGVGKLTAFATGNNQHDGAGGYNGFYIGGSLKQAAEDTTPPRITLYLNEPSFQSGDVVAPKPVLHAVFADEAGIKISRKSLTLTMPLFLNGEQVDSIEDFYVAAADSYQTGRILYPLGQLAPGRYTLALRAQDNYNNASEESIAFVVSREKPLKITALKAYPNPVHESITFSFAHDKKNDVLRVDFSLYDMVGRQLLTYFWKTPGNNGEIKSLYWDRTQGARRFPSGTYVYVFTVRDEEDGTSNKVRRRIIFAPQ